MKRVEIEWVDSVAEERWVSTESAIRAATREAMLHRTIGYLVAENDEMVLVACSRQESDEYVCNTMQIPRVAVLRIKPLRGGA